MINLRYHIVSITAVFLALGIGVALGSTLIERGLVDTLNTRLDEQAERLDRTDGENAELREELGEIDELQQRLTEEGTALFAGHLDEVPVLALTVQGTSDDVVDLTRRSLRASGATVAGVLRVTSRWEDLNEEEITELAEIAGTVSTNPGTVRSLVLRELADEVEDAARFPEGETATEGEGLTGSDDASIEGEDPVEGQDPVEGEDPAVGEDPVEGEDPESEVEVVQDPEPTPVPSGAIIDALVARGYLEFLPDGASTPLPAHGLRVVVVVDEGRSLADDLVLLPLVEELGGVAPAPVLVAEAFEPDEEENDQEGDLPAPAGPLVAAIRTDEGLASSISTVDAPRRFVGQSAIVLGIADLVSDRERVGHYGLAAGASALLPPVGE